MNCPLLRGFHYSGCYYIESTLYKVFQKGLINLVLRDLQEFQETVDTKSQRVNTSQKNTEFFVNQILMGLR